MNCDLTHTVLHGYLDAELDAVRAADFERHLELCPECVAALEAQRSLRSSIQRARLYERAPQSLRSQILPVLGAGSPVASFPRRAMGRWLAVAAAVVLLVYASSRIPAVLRTNKDRDILAAQIVDAHLRSLQPGHLTDVLSSDQHTVKPWFDGRLNFAPAVRDFADRGFPLEGGRLDIVQGRTVAALVYGRRKHLINVFVWPDSQSNAAPRSGAQQGYQWIEWRKGGMEMWAVSDVNAADLAELQRLLD